MKYKLTYYLTALLLVVLTAFAVKPGREEFYELPFPAYSYTAKASDVFREPEPESTQIATHVIEEDSTVPSPEALSP